MENEKDMVVLIHKHLTHQLLPEEELELKEWLQESQEHRELYQDIRLGWEYAQQPQLEIAEEEVEHELTLLRQRITAPEAAVPFRRLKVFMYAAVLALLLVGGWLAYQFNRVGDPEKIAIAYHEHPEITLPDSSQVSLQPSSRISYQMDGAYREVELSGEAYFEVARDEERPFLIHLEEVTIKVLGTSFLVRAYPGQSLQVLVTSGLVEVKHGEEVVRLQKGEEAVLEAGDQLVKREILHPNLLAWKTKELTFRNTPLKEVLQDVEGYYDVTFHVERPEILACRYTGSFKEVALSDLLKILSYSLQLEINAQGDKKFRVSGKGCQ